MLLYNNSDASIHRTKKFRISGYFLALTASCCSINAHVCRGQALAWGFTIPPRGEAELQLVPSRWVQMLVHHGGGVRQQPQLVGYFPAISTKALEVFWSLKTAKKAHSWHSFDLEQFIKKNTIKTPFLHQFETLEECFPVEGGGRSIILFSDSFLQMVEIPVHLPPSGP